MQRPVSVLLWGVHLVIRAWLVSSDMLLQPFFLGLLLGVLQDLSPASNALPNAPLAAWDALAC
jgi:hypothetical protein